MRRLDTHCRLQYYTRGCDLMPLQSRRVSEDRAEVIEMTLKHTLKCNNIAILQQLPLKLEEWLENNIFFNDRCSRYDHKCPGKLASQATESAAP